MLKKMIILAAAFSASAIAANNESSRQITVTGSVYRSCEVSWPTVLDMGARRASGWGDSLFMNVPTGDSEAFITLSGCDEGTTVKIQAEASASESWYMRNLDAEQDITANLAAFEESNRRFLTLNMERRNSVTATVINDAMTTYNIRLRGLMRRTSLEISPVGTFRATPTLYITFE